jgi:hypothetical protein
MSPDELRTYSLKLCGSLDDDFISAYFPAGTCLTQRDECSRLENLQTDQSGIIGLLRQLHNLGCVILEMSTEKEIR